MLRLEDVTVSYGPVLAVRQLNLHVDEGEIVALLGANGAGKTSTLLAIMGLARSRGAVKFAGRDITGLRTERIVRMGLTLVPEGRRVFPGLTVFENLLLGQKPKQGSSRSALEEDELFDLFPILRERRNQLAGTLSGGEQQQLAIARALMSAPDLILLDEPSLGLAPRLADRMFDAIKALHARGLTVLLVEQNVNLALQVADRAYVLASGDLKMEGRPTELLATTGISRAYLGVGVS